MSMRNDRTGREKREKKRKRKIIITLLRVHSHLPHKRVNWLFCTKEKKKSEKEKRCTVEEEEKRKETKRRLEEVEEEGGGGGEARKQRSGEKWWHNYNCCSCCTNLKMFKSVNKRAKAKIPRIQAHTQELNVKSCKSRAKENRTDQTRTELPLPIRPLCGVVVVVGAGCTAAQAAQ